eukprot:168350-Chlamydomonas_euryale.AAC.4
MRGTGGRTDGRGPSKAPDSFTALGVLPPRDFLGRPVAMRAWTHRRALTSAAARAPPATLIASSAAAPQTSPERRWQTWRWLQLR